MASGKPQHAKRARSRQRPHRRCRCRRARRHRRLHQHAHHQPALAVGVRKPPAHLLVPPPQTLTHGTEAYLSETNRSAQRFGGPTLTVRGPRHKGSRRQNPNHDPSKSSCHDSKRKGSRHRSRIPSNCCGLLLIVGCSSFLARPERKRCSILWLCNTRLRALANEPLGTAWIGSACTTFFSRHMPAWAL